MRDLTQGSVTGHLLGMAGFIAVGLIVQTLYFLIDLYFVGSLGSHALAGVSTVGIVWMLGMGAAQILGIGALSLVSRAIGAKQTHDAQLVFDQALGLSLVAAVSVLTVGYLLAPVFLANLGADAETAAASRAYLYAFLPGVALLLPGSVLSSGLRAAGVVAPPMAIQSATVLLNAVLAPVLIAGWGTGAPLGVAGAGLATTLASMAGLTTLWLLFGRMQTLLRIELKRPDLGTWRRITGIGLPAGGEFVLMFTIASTTYWVIRDHGATAQAGFGVGMRVMQSIFLPAMAVSFAAAPIAGQNFGAGNGERVRETFRQAVLIGSAIMVALSVLCHLEPEWVLAPFARDPATLAVAVEYLKIASWNFLAMGVIFACSGLFQALGDTRPALISSASRLLTYALPAVLIARQPWLTLPIVWWISLVSVFAQAGFSWWLLQREFRRKLTGLVPPAAPATAPQAA